MSDMVRVTPLMGGKMEGAVCSLLEIGGCRILLDCGGVVDFDFSFLMSIVNELVAGGGIDAVVISHADMDHMGSLPMVFGRLGLGGVPVICTTPVSKFGKMILYDFCLNKGMEGSLLSSTPESQQQFELDDIDLALSNVTTVKYSQTIHLPGIAETAGARRHVSLCAYPSGRTIGGSIWRIRHGATEVLYVMDINLKKEVVLDGVGLALLPTAPALLIVEGGSVSRGAAVGKQVILKRGKKEDSVGLVSTVMDALRDGGNVLIPCEAGRALEVMQVLGKHWLDNKLGMYHLIFLSHMAFNILEYAKSQLEWMSDSLSKGFYNGKPNPFELAPVRLVTSVRELERSYPGPKVVLATDSSLSCGLSKALLLRWGGDPRCRVVFTDTPEAKSLAAELRGQAPPVLAMVHKPVKTLLAGEELAAHQRELERVKLLKEEFAQRKRREEELAALAGGRADDGENEDEDDEDDADGDEVDDQAVSLGAKSPSTFKRRKLQPSSIAKFVEPYFPMFETREIVYTTDDYGASTNDLKFQDITATTFSSRFSRVHPAIAATAAAAAAALVAAGGQVQNPSRTRAPTPAAEEAEQADAADMDNPWKLVAVRTRVQFTCGLKDVGMSGRADFKAIKTVISQLAPSRVVVLRGRDSDCKEIAAYAKSNGIDSFAPANREPIEFKVQANRVRLQLLQNLLPPSMTSVLGQSGALSGSKESICQVCAITGRVVELADTGLDGIKIVRLLPPVTVSEDEESDDIGTGPIDGESEGEEGEGAGLGEGSTEDQGGEKEDSFSDEAVMKGKSKGKDMSRPRGNSIVPVDSDEEEEAEEGIVLADLSVGVVSVGDVLLNNLKQHIEAAGITVEFRLTASGGVLVCGSQVIVRKESDNDFVIEGPPVHAYWEARKALYQQYAFV